VFLTVYLLVEIGWVGVIAPLLIAVLIGCQKFVNDYNLIVNREKLNCASKRSSKVEELLRGIKIIKFNAWEFVIEKLIRAIRQVEQTAIVKMQMMNGISELICLSYPLLCSLMIIWIYNSQHVERMSIETTLAVAGMFNVCVHPLRGFLLTLLNIDGSQAAFERIEVLMDCEEASDFVEDQAIEVGRVIIDNGTFSWDSQSIRDYFSEKKPA
jgi:ATP-binding cassette subfamily C (CFTR/MRP) protein 1